MPLPILWRREAELRRDALRLVAWGAAAASALALAAPAAEPAHWALAHLPLLLAAAAVLGLALAEPRGARALLVAGLAAAGLVAEYGWPGVTGHASIADLRALPWFGTSGAAAGLVTSLGLLPRHVRWGSRRVRRASRACATALGEGACATEIAALATQAAALWDRVEIADEAVSPVRATLEDAVERILALARRSAEAAGSAGLPAPAALEMRMQALETRAASCADEVAKSHFFEARDALAAQLRHVRSIEVSRERVLAQLHRYVTAAEQLQLAALSHHSADAASRAAALRPFLDDLDRLGQDLDGARLAIAVATT